jgi:hypothetical protein
MQTNQNLLNARRHEIRTLLDQLTYTCAGHAQDEIHEQLRLAIADARRVRRILSEPMSS